MKALIYYYSKYKNNTKKIAEAMAKTIGGELIYSEKLTNIDTKDYDLIGFGSDVYVRFKLFNKKAVEILTSKGAVAKGNF